MSTPRTFNTQVDGLVEEVLTREQQAALTPARVIEMLREGNARFARGEVTLRNHVEQVRRAAASQFPKAIILSCVDSRVPVEDVFDRGIGDLFVARIAGNFANVDILGSMEFACKVSGAKLVLVLGHEHCGAVKGAIDGVELGNLTAMLANIRPAVEAVAAEAPEPAAERTSANAAFVHRVAEENVRRTIAHVRAESPLLREMESAGEIAIVGAMYDMDTGEVEWMA